MNTPYNRTHGEVSSYAEGFRDGEKSASVKYEADLQRALKTNEELLELLESYRKFADKVIEISEKN
jgi:hypothetical protein